MAAWGPDDPLARAAELTLSGSQTDFPVLDADEVVGILTQADLVRGLSEYGESSAVSETMHREFHTAGPREMIEPMFLRFQSVLGDRGARRSSARKGGGGPDADLGASADRRRARHAAVAKKLTGGFRAGVPAPNRLGGLTLDSVEAHPRTRRRTGAR